MSRLAPQVKHIAVGEVRNVAIDASPKLDSGESLSGTPTVAEVSTSDLTITSEQVSASVKEIDGKDVAAGEAIQFRVDAVNAVVGRTYYIDVSCDTDASQTVKGRVTLIGV